MESRWHEIEYSQTSFHDIEGLDKRLVQGLKRLGFVGARPVQVLTFAHAFAGADILLKAPTGTGKTLAYAVPLINSVLSRLSSSDGLISADYVGNEATNSKINWRHRYEAIILAPSRELVHQITSVVKDLCYLFSDLIRPIGLTECPKQLRELADKLAISNVLITNPGSLVASARLIGRSLSAGPGRSYINIFPNVKHLVLDEADLVLSVYGYEDEVSEIFSPSPLSETSSSASSAHFEKVAICPTDHLSSSKAQVMLVSATVNQDLKTIREMALYRPKVLSVICMGEALPDLTGLDDPKYPGHFEFLRLEIDTIKKCDHRFMVVDRKKCEDYLILCGILKENHFSMNEVAPKTLVFTNSPTSAAKCQLILSSFGFKVGRAIGTQCLTDRLSNIQKFNSGLLDVLITMDSELLTENDAPEVSEKTASPKKRRKKDKASLLSRGLDYKQVARVVLLEPASSLEDYVHKVGRCGRDQEISNFLPTAISLLTSAELNEPAWSEQIADRYQPTCPDDFALGSFVKYQYRVEDFSKKASKQAIKNLLDSD